MHDALEVVRGHLQQRLAMLHAGVVDEDVQGTDPLLDPLYRRLYGDLVGDVERHGVHCAAGVPRKLGAGLLQRLGITSVEHDLGPGFGQSCGQGQADALAGAGDQGPTAGQGEQRAASWSRPVGMRHGRTSAAP